MKSMKILLASALAALAFGTCAFAENTQFADVSENAWYKADVMSVCEEGYMNGVGDGLFSPDSTFTVAQGITVAARLNATQSGKAIAQAQAGQEWYTPYVDYAVSEGIVSDGQFESFTRDITRAEMALLFAKSVNKDSFTKINDVKEIPDVDKAEEYAEELLMLYNAGVLSGSDEYGYFHPNNSIKRSEASAIINRTANMEARKSFTLKEIPKDTSAYYLIDDQSLLVTTRSIPHLASSWNYENRSSRSLNTDGSTTNTLSDTYNDGYVSINRNIKVTSEGNVTLLSTFEIAGTYNADGARIYFENSDSKNVIEVCTDNGVFNVVTDKVYPTTVKATNGTYNIRLSLDLDGKAGVLVINGQKACEFNMGEFKDLSRIYYSTSKEDILTFVPSFVQLFVNYHVNDTFFEGQVPYDYKGQAKIKSFTDSRDTYSLELDKTGEVSKSFEKAQGKVSFEAYVYMPNKVDSAYISLKSGDESKVKVNISQSQITAGGISHTFKNHIWQCIRIVADTDKKTATLYVNGKNKGDFSFDADGFDGFTLGFDKKSDHSVYFDDIKVNTLYDYPDYCPKPNKVNSDDYIVFMSVCSLWREGTHYGWDYVSPYDECTPIMGYYDEGNPEAMDWEIKYMAEHGVDAMQYCWYSAKATDFDVPQKNPRLSWALNDGYMYAKYSDMVDFSLLWEAASFKDAKITIDQFKTQLWDYWVEWYFRDSRYMTINNKAVLQFYAPKNFITAIGGEQNAKTLVNFMRNDIKNYGYDGLILLATSDCSDIAFAKQLSRIGFDGAGAYGWDQNGYDPEYSNDVNQRGIDNVSDIEGFAYLPTISAGKNILGWENTRNPMATVEQHRAGLEGIKAMLKEQGKVKGNEWQDKMVYFSTWNEFGEGHWLAPSGLNGFGYVDEYRKAFTNAPLAHVDTAPTIKQMERICRLYNNERQPIRSLLLEDYSVNGETDTLYSIKIDSTTDLSKWRFSNLVNQKIQDNAIYGKSIGADPIVWPPEDLNVNAKAVTSIKIRAKVAQIGQFQMFFITNNDKTWNENKSFKATVTTANEYIDVVYDTTKNKYWADTITAIRIDPLVTTGEFYIKSVEFIGMTDGQVNSKPKVTVDGTELKLFEQYIFVTDFEYYITADPATGILSANNLYYEWNRHKGTLYLKSGNDTEFLFTVGSDKALVNGKALPLNKAFYTFDGMPVLPMKFVLSNAGIAYKISENKLEISIRDIDFNEIKDSRIPYEYEFNMPDDKEGWVTGAGTSYVSDGNLVLTASYVPSISTGHDPKIHKSGLDIPCDKYSKVIVRMKYTLLPNENGTWTDDKMSVYFGTSIDNNLSEAKSVKVLFTDGVDDGDGYKLYTFDMASNENWKGKIQTLRFDPSNNNGIYTIDYVRVIE